MRIGFEISYVSGFYTQILGIKAELVVPFIFAFSLFISVFCTIGGFSANAKTDRVSNLLATSSLFIILICLVIYKNVHGVVIKDLTLKPLAQNPWSFYFGVIFFGLYQMVDMTNWQTVSANSLHDDRESVKAMQRKIRKAGIEIFFFPIVLGTIAGWLLRSITANITQESILSEISRNYLPFNGIISVILLSIFTFSFFAASLSASDSWLLASSQTVSWDLTDYKVFSKYAFAVKHLSDEQHQTILRKARVILIIVGVAVTGLIYWVSLRWNQVFALQFVMFGAGLSMIPALLYGLFYCKNEHDGKQIKNGAFLSIALGFITSLSIFFWSIVVNDPNIVNCIPYVTLIISSVIILIAVFITKLRVKA